MEISSTYDNTSQSHVWTTENDSLFSESGLHTSGDNGFYSTTSFTGGYNFTPDAYTVPYNDSNNGTAWYDNYYSEEYYYDYYYLEIFQFEIITMGYIRPILIIITTLTNVLVCAFFLTQKNRGKATNLLFISISFSDTMTGIALLPNSLAVYAADYTDVSKGWCLAYMITRFYVSRVFHTVSVWQTVILSIQRYMCVCHPFISNRICTFWKTFVSICITYVLAALLHIYHLLDDKVGHARCRWNLEVPCGVTCIYLWFCIAVQHFLPCLLLLGLTIKTLQELKKAQRRVSTMSHRSNSSTRFTRDKIITITAILIVVCFLIPELPHGIYKVVFVIIEHIGNRNILNPYRNHVILCIYEISLIISFNANFWIYCAMMHDFRRMSVRIVTCGMVRLRRGVSRLRSISQSSRRSNVSRTSSNVSRQRVFSRTTSLHSTTSDVVNHTTIPLTPTKGYDKIIFSDNSTAQNTEENLRDDVF